MNKNNVTGSQRKKDGARTKASRQYNNWHREQNEIAINKLPNELRQGEHDWNEKNIYDGGSFCGLYVDE